MCIEHECVKKVIEQRGNNVLIEHNGEIISVPMSGYFPGEELSPGECATLAHDENGDFVVKPLRKYEYVDVLPNIDSNVMTINDRQLAIQENR